MEAPHTKKQRYTVWQSVSQTRAKLEAINMVKKDINYFQLRRSFVDMAQAIFEFLGKKFPLDVINNVMMYARQLPAYAGGMEIGEDIFNAQMAEHFGLTSTSMLQKMYRVCCKTERAPFVMDVSDYCELVCTFMADNLRIKADFVFNCYSSRGKDGMFITRKELVGSVRPMVLEFADDDLDGGGEMEIINYFVDLITTKVDLDSNGKIDRWEFHKLVSQDILMLQFLGPCLPDGKHINVFKKKIYGKSKFEVQAIFRNERQRTLKSYDNVKKGMIIQDLYPVPLELP